MVHGFAQLLTERAPDLDHAAVGTQAQRILSASTQLAHLVQDLLDFARLERGEVAVHPQDGDLIPVLEEALADLGAGPAESAWWPTSPRAFSPTPTRRASPRW